MRQRLYPGAGKVSFRRGSMTRFALLHPSYAFCYYHHEVPLLFCPCREDENQKRLYMIEPDVFSHLEVPCVEERRPLG